MNSSVSVCKRSVTSKGLSGVGGRLMAAGPRRGGGDNDIFAMFEVRNRSMTALMMLAVILLN